MERFLPLDKCSSEYLQKYGLTPEEAQIFSLLVNKLDLPEDDVVIGPIIQEVLVPIGSLNCRDNERETILKALEKHKGHRKEASKELGISERTLYRKINEYKAPGGLNKDGSPIRIIRSKIDTSHVTDQEILDCMKKYKGRYKGVITQVAIDLKINYGALHSRIRKIRLKQSETNI